AADHELVGHSEQSIVGCAAEHVFGDTDSRDGVGLTSVARPADGTGMSLVATDRAPLDVAEALRADRRASELARIRVVLLGALIVLVPLASARIFWTDPGGDANLNRAVALAPFDLALLGLLVVWLLTDRVGTVVRRP